MLGGISWSGRCRLTFKERGSDSWCETVLWTALARKMVGELGAVGDK